MHVKLKEIQAEIEALCDKFNSLSEKLTIEEPSEEPSWDYPRVAYIIGHDEEGSGGRIHDNTGWFPSATC